MQACQPQEDFFRACVGIISQLHWNFQRIKICTFSALTLELFRDYGGQLFIPETGDNLRRFPHLHWNFSQLRRKISTFPSDFFRSYVGILVYSTVTLEITLRWKSQRGESAWESNPPARLVTPPNRFEDGGQHRPTPTLISNATEARDVRQVNGLHCKK